MPLSRLVVRLLLDAPAQFVEIVVDLLTFGRGQFATIGVAIFSAAQDSSQIVKGAGKRENACFTILFCALRRCAAPACGIQPRAIKGGWISFIAVRSEAALAA